MPASLAGMSAPSSTSGTTATTEVLYALVLVAGRREGPPDPAPTRPTSASTAGKIRSTRPTAQFAWVNGDGTLADGFEGRRRLAPGSYTLRAHILVADDSADGYTPMDISRAQRPARDRVRRGPPDPGHAGAHARRLRRPRHPAPTRHTGQTHACADAVDAGADRRAADRCRRTTQDAEHPSPDRHARRDADRASRAVVRLHGSHCSAWRSSAALLLTRTADGPSRSRSRRPRPEHDLRSGGAALTRAAAIAAGTSRHLAAPSPAPPDLGGAVSGVVERRRNRVLQPRPVPGVGTGRRAASDPDGRRPPRRFAAVGPRPAPAGGYGHVDIPRLIEGGVAIDGAGRLDQGARDARTSTATTTGPTTSRCSPSPSAGHARRGAAGWPVPSTWRSRLRAMAADSAGRR